MSSDREIHFDWNLPNILGWIRIFGSIAMIVFAVFQLKVIVVITYLILGFTDLIDGPMARWQNQESPSGAKLDSVADVLLSGSLLISVSILEWDRMFQERAWLVLAALSYGVVILVSFRKFGRPPALHTWSAKLNHFLVAVAGVCVLLDVSMIALRIACITTTLTNLESLLILARLRDWQTDVKSVFHFRGD